MILLAMADYTEKAASGWYFKLPLGVAVSAYAQYFASDPYVFSVFVAVFFLDLIVGAGRAIKDGSFRPRRFCLWFVKLTTYSLCLGVVGLLNGAIQHSWGRLPWSLLDTVLIVLIASEALSIFENLHEMGYQVPPVLHHLAIGVKTKAGRKLDALLDDDSKDGKGAGNG